MISPNLQIAGAILLGLIVGSFLAAASYRLPRNIPLNRPSRSHCPECRQLITWWQNIPLFSFLLLRGRCYHCHERISLRYPAAEIASALMALFFVSEFGWSYKTLYYLIFSWTLLLISLIDVEWKRIPNDLNLFMLIWLVGANLLLQVLPWWPAIKGLLASTLLLYTVRWLSLKIYDKEGMGMGDVKLAASLGFVTGISGFLSILFIGSLLAILSYPLLKRIIPSAGQLRIPFAPFLTIATLIILLRGNWLWDSYWSFLS